MKRYSRLLAGAVVLTLLLAVPATAYAQYGPGDVWLWLGESSPEAPGVSGPPVPAGEPITLVAGWFAYTKGLTKTAPTIQDVSFELYKASWDSDPLMVVTPKMGRAGWQGEYVLTPENDEMGLLEIPPFNPRIGAKMYYNWWLYPVGQLEPGTYYLHTSWMQRHAITDLTWWFDGQHGALIYDPAEWSLPDLWQKIEVVSPS
jgi:hypothetical protein